MIDRIQGPSGRPRWSRDLVFFALSWSARGPVRERRIIGCRPRRRGARRRAAALSLCVLRSSRRGDHSRDADWGPEPKIGARRIGSVRARGCVALCSIKIERARALGALVSGSTDAAKRHPDLWSCSRVRPMHPNPTQPSKLPRWEKRGVIGMERIFPAPHIPAFRGPMWLQPG